MAVAKSAPGWGKATGIIMIILGGFGIFWNIYRLIMPAVLRVQQNMMHNIAELNHDENMENMGHVFNKMLSMDRTTENMLFGFSIVGLILCVIYIIGGVKLLKAKPENLNFAKMILLVALIVGVVQYILMFSFASGIFIIGILFYNILGTLFDLVLYIILMASNKDAYNPEHSDTLDAAYTRDAGEVL